MSIKNNIKYQDGGDPIKGKKPKKRIILAETPTAIDKSYNLVPIDSKKYPLGTFSADIMREGRNKLLDEIVSLEKRLGIEQEGRDDGSDLLDDIFGATNSSMSISEITKIVKDNYGVDISKEDGIIDAYKRATGYPGVIKYGFDKYDLKETITETKDDTFLQEAKKAARLSKENGVPAEVVPIYGKEQFEQFKARYNKEALNGADIVILGHSSDKKMFGVPNKELNDFLRDNMDSSNICYGGTCTGPKVAASMPDVPNMYVNMGEPWIGVPDYKSYAGRDFNETFFGNAEVFNGQDEWATAKPIRAKYGVDYTNYRKDPVTILSETPEVVNIPRPQQNIQPLPTIQSGVSRMQNGGGTNRKSSYNSDIENKLNKLYLSEKYKKASKLDKAGMIAEIDPLSLLQKGLGAGIAMTGIPALLRNLTVEKAVVGAGLAGASGVTGLLAGQLASDPIKNKINRAVGANIYPTKTASDRNIITRDTTIDLSNNNLSFARVGEKVPANILLGGEFTENSNDSVRKAKDWLNSVKSTYSDKKLKVSDVKDFYGVENGSFKVGKPEDFNEETLIVPNRFGNEKIANASVVNDGLRLTSNSGDIIYNNIPVGGKLILYSPSTKKSSFISFETPNKGADEINKFVKENKDAQPIILDNGRYRSYINNPKGISDANYDNYYNLDKKRKNTPGYNILINSSGTDKETTVKKKQDGGAANYLEQILGAVNQGNPFTPKNEKASLLGYDTWLKDNGYTSFWDKANKQKEYANYVASNKSFNEQLPLGPNFGGLFELNQMATDEQLNKKDTLADYTKSISTYAPQGFAEEGGMVDGQAADKFPSLQAILAGLPKEMKAKDKQKVAANAQLELQQILGYKDNSPYKDLPSQDFNTDTLTMDGVSQALMAIANNGQTKLMQPNSGTHYFPGATQITEVPMAQQGGGPRQMIFNLFKQKPMSKYENGGFSQRAPSYQFNLPVGNKTKVSGFLPLESLIPIQTEKKELIVLPDGSVVPVNAKQRHSQMTDDQVTDIVPENSYILSQFGQVDIYRSEADEVIIETENKPYNLYGVNPEPRVKTLGDIMNKKVMKPADLGRALTTKYKQIDNAGDPYTQQTNMANKETLSKYLQALIGLSEMDKARKGIDNSMETQMSQGQLPQMVAANGGTVMRSSNVPKAQLGLIAGAGASLLTGAFNYFSNRSAQKKADQNQAASLAEIAKWRNQQLGLSNTGLGIGMASVFAQDPTVDPVLQQSGFLDSMQKGLPQQFLDYQQSRNLANRPDFSGLGAQESNALNTQYYSQTLNSQSALALQAARDRAAMFNQYLQAKGQIQNFNIASRTNATNATRVNANNMLSTAGGIGMGNITDRQNIETNALQSKLAANNNALQFSLNRMGSENQGYLNSLALGTQVYNSITANQPAVNQNNVQPRSTDQYQDPYGFNGTQGYGMSNYTSNPYDFTANAAPTGAGPLYSQNNPSDCILGRNIRTGLPC